MQAWLRAVFATVGLLLVCALPVSSAWAEPAQYSIDPTHTFVSFEIDHFATSTNRGRFDKKQGSITFDSAAKTGKVQISVDVASVSTGTAQFDAFLQSFELFDAATFPTFTFVSDAFVFNGEQLAEVQGQLTLLGKTQPVVFKVNRFNCYRSPVFRREVCGGDLEATIDRTQWGINYGLIFGFPKAVRLLVQVEAIKL
jgi:polyisoprenoid-binding protein YceI